jgi:AbiV family abortive infection protein
VRAVAGAGLSPESLLDGAGRSVEQAGRLLEDAAALLSWRRFSSAIVLAVFAREELGRCHVLLGCRLEVLNGKELQPADVRRRTNDHAAKLDAGQQSSRLDLSSQQGQRLLALRERRDAAGFTEARRALSIAAKRKRAGEPQSTHNLRMRALYVEPQDNGTWNQPSQISEQEAVTIVREVQSDYILLLDSIEHDEQADVAPLAGWAGRSNWPQPTSG